MRKLLFNLHLWVALAAGIFIVILCVTGAIMAIETEIDHAANPHLFYVAPQQNARPLPELGDAAMRNFPGEHVVAYGLPLTPEFSTQIHLKNGTVVFVNPYTAEVLGTRRGPNLLSRIHQFHIRLLAGETGEHILAVANGGLLFLLVSGIYLWWPIKRVAIDWAAPARRFWFDVHNSVGIFSFIILLLLSATGMFMTLQDEVELAYRLTGTQPAQFNFTPSPTTGSAPFIPDQAVKIAREALPGATPIFMNVPNAKSVYRVALRFPEDLTPGGRSRVFIDPNSGKVLQVESSRTTVAGTRIINTNRALHTGDIFGLPSKIVFSLACLFAVVQAGSGVLMWWKRKNNSSV